LIAISGASSTKPVTEVTPIKRIETSKKRNKIKQISKYSTIFDTKVFEI
jgi:hypothetical protein